MAPPPGLIQGNVLRGFGRRYAAYVFLRFDAGMASFRTKWRELAERVVTTAEQQQQIAPKPSPRGSMCSQTMGMIGVSASGYDRLGIKRPEFVQGGDLRRPKGQVYLWRADVSTWEEGYKEDIDAFVLLADDDANRLAGAFSRTKQDIAGLGTVVSEEQGYRWNANGDGVSDFEHFGFADGIGKPKNPEAVLGPGSQDGEYGCFAVFLKFEQNVPRFRQLCEELQKAAVAQGANVTVESVEAMMIGRRKDGTPLAPLRSNDLDDFDYRGVAADVCPYQAHIRTMNPRLGTETETILRRGILYGPREGQPEGSSGVGLLFLSLQRSIYDFLSMMSRGWKSLDPLISGGADWPPEGAKNVCPGQDAQKWQFGQREVCFRMADITTLRGGQYFFIPGIPFFRNL